MYISGAIVKQGYYVDIQIYKKNSVVPTLEI